MSEFKKIKVAVEKQFEDMVQAHHTLFVSNVEKDAIWDKYLESFPEGTNPIFRERTEHDCSCCRQFVKNIGGVLAVGSDNKLISVWDVVVDEYPYDVVAKELSTFVKSQGIQKLFLAELSRYGLEKNAEYLQDLGKTITWNHFCATPKGSHLVLNSVERNAKIGEADSNKSVFERSMIELSVSACETILDLVSQGSLYKGDEFKPAVVSLKKYMEAYLQIPSDLKDNWLWLNSQRNHVARIRNTAIGTLLVDLSKGVDLEEAVRKFEAVTAPTNYKRPKAIFTKKMVEAAEKTITDLGLLPNLQRRYATSRDLSVNDIKHINRSLKGVVQGSVFSELLDESKPSAQKLDKVEEIHIEKFLSSILPNATSVEVMVSSEHEPNLMSLIAPVNESENKMFKWDNDFSWAYNGDITDSGMKERVKKAGGKVDGDLRFSIEWNNKSDNNSDLDAHCVTPTGQIYFSQMLDRATGGVLDVDIRNPDTQTQDGIGVENITWSDKRRLVPGNYVFKVHQFAVGIRNRSGFSAEIEFDGKIHGFSYPAPLRQGEYVEVATVKVAKDGTMTLVEKLNSTTSVKDMWGIKTNKWVPVSVVMLSPNHWNESNKTGNKHYFFILQGCKNPGSPRGFFNEFLREDLNVHRKVFEALGAKMSVAESDDQLSGLGFSSTKRNELLVKVGGSFNRVLKIKF